MFDSYCEAQEHSPHKIFAKTPLSYRVLYVDVLLEIRIKTRTDAKGECQTERNPVSVETENVLYLIQ